MLCMFNSYFLWELGPSFSLFRWRRFLSNLLLLLFSVLLLCKFMVLCLSCVEHQETCWKSISNWVRPADSVFHYCAVSPTKEWIKGNENETFPCISTHPIVKWLLIGSRYQIVSASGRWSAISAESSGVKQPSCRLLWWESTFQVSEGAGYPFNCPLGLSAASGMCLASLSWTR